MGGGEHASFSGVYWFNKNEPQTQTSKRVQFQRFKVMVMNENLENLPLKR